MKFATGLIFLSLAALWMSAINGNETLIIVTVLVSDIAIAATIRTLWRKNE